MASHGDYTAKAHIDYYLILLADGDLWGDKIAELSSLQLPGCDPESLIIVTAQWDRVRDSGGFVY